MRNKPTCPICNFNGIIHNFYACAFSSLFLYRICVLVFLNNFFSLPFLCLNNLTLLIYFVIAACENRANFFKKQAVMFDIFTF